VRLDDDLWQVVWDQTLSNIERHRIARSTIRREEPVDALERRLVPELARRWRRTAGSHVFGHVLLLLFWALVFHGGRNGPRGEIPFLVGMSLFSGTVIAIAVALRRYLVPVTYFDGVGPR
jgi:hypothetical protein